LTFHVRARRVRLVQLRVLGEYVLSHSSYSPSTPGFIPRTRRVRSISFGVLAESAQLCVPDVYGGITKRIIPIPHSLFSLFPSLFSSLSSLFFSLSSPFSSLPVCSTHCPVRSPHWPVRSPHWSAVLLTGQSVLLTGQPFSSLLFYFHLPHGSSKSAWSF